MFRKFKGRLLIADEQPMVLERSFERDKVVVHAAIAVDRKAGADAIVLMLRGWQPPVKTGS